MWVEEGGACNFQNLKVSTLVDMKAPICAQKNLYADMAGPELRTLCISFQCCTL